MARRSKRKRKQKAIVQQRAQAQKSIGYSDFSTWMGGTTQSHDIMRSKWGAAVAYAQVHQINICTTILVNAIAGLRWELVNFGAGADEEGDVIASSDDMFPKHPLTLAMREFRRENGQSMLATIMFDRTLYGETFLEKSLEIVGNPFGNKSLDWLNPLGVTVDYDALGIQSFRYGWAQQYVNIDARKVAYMHTRNPFDDYVGYSRVQAAMAKVNIERNLDAFFRDFFANNAIPAMVVQPADGLSTHSDRDKLNMEQALRTQFKGLGNQHRALVLKKRVDITPLDNPDVGKQYQLENEISVQIFEAMGVPQVLAGNASGTTFKDSDDTSKWFFFNTVLPEAREIAQYLNTQVLPFFDPSRRTIFRFDTSAFDEITESDRLEAEVIEIQLGGGLISLYDAAKKQELDPPDELKDLYRTPSGNIVPLSELAAFWEKQLLIAPSVFNVAQITDEPLPQPTDPNQVVPTAEGGEPVVTGEPLEAGDLPPGDDEPPALSRQKDNAAQDDHDHSHFDWLRVYEGDDLFPDEHIIDGRMLDELEQWQRFVIAKWGKQNTRPFVTTVLPPFVRHVVIDRLNACTGKHEARQAFKGVLEDAALRSIRSYQGGLRKLARALWNESISGSSFESDMVSLINTEFEAAYRAGFKRAGVKPRDMTSEDLDELDTLISDEIRHVNELAIAIEDNSKSKGGKIEPIRARVDRWVSRYVGVSEFAFVVAMRDTPITWTWNPAKEHCRSCTRLNGKTYRASKWRALGIHPRSSKLDCFGIFCGCGFFDAEGNPLSRGRVPSF